MNIEDFNLEDLEIIIDFCGMKEENEMLKNDYEFKEEFTERLKEVYYKCFPRRDKDE